jgi:predicted GIY-YIG superfamily endonuclease
MCEQKWHCYILKSSSCNKTYNGSTNDLKRRLRQHNGELVGGAMATQSGRPHEFICVVSGFVEHTKALSCEWWIKHPTGKRKRPSQYSRPFGRIKGLNYLFHSNIWNEKFGNEILTCTVKDEYKLLLTELPKNITLEIL